ncbi:MAG: hypothetical protein AB7P03_29730, partial [Kofleriaceae bacterium]
SPIFGAPTWARPHFRPNPGSRNPGAAVDFPTRNRDPGSELASDDGEAADYEGHVTDLRVSGEYFPRSVWDGAHVDMGGFARRRDHRRERDGFDSDALDTQSLAIGGIAQVGWSWLTGSGSEPTSSTSWS